MKKRLFIAINLENNIKEKLTSHQKKFKDIPARWIKPENIHITLVFLGYIKENKIKKINFLIETIASSYKNFKITLEKITYGPPFKPARMIWVTIQKNKILKKIQNDLENILLKNKILLKKENRNFSPHITLCRFNIFDFKKIKNPPIVKQKLNWEIVVDSIDLMESKLFRTGAKYFLIKKFKLGK